MERLERCAVLRDDRRRQFEFPHQCEGSAAELHCDDPATVEARQLLVCLVDRRATVDHDDLSVLGLHRAMLILALHISVHDALICDLDLVATALDEYLGRNSAPSIDH